MITTLHVGTTFLVADDAGQVSSGTDGLYFQDARFLSLWQLLFDGKQPLSLSTLRLSPRESVHVATNPDLVGAPHDTLAVSRRRLLSEDGLIEEIEVKNYGDKEAVFTLGLRMAADFGSIFQVKSNAQSGSDTTTHDGVQSARSDRRHWRFTHESHGKKLETEVDLSDETSGADGSGNEARFSVRIPRRGSWKIEARVRMRIEGKVSTSRTSSRKAEPATEHAQRLRAAAPILETDHPVLAAAYQQASEDIVALRIKAAETEGYEIAAGIPWYMTLFGRDSLIASYQTMLHDPSIARGTLRALANLQGTRVDAQTLEEPGRILHEYRSGIATSVRRKVPRFPYYGTIDATPLFLVVVAEYVRVTGDLDFAREIWEHVEGALRWVEEYGDRDGDGLVEYDPGEGSWLQNLGWKDSGDSIRFRDGKVARPSIALVEVQGYAVEAFRGVAELTEVLGKPGAAQLRQRADRLAAAIDERYWLPDRAFYAEALDGQKKRVDALTSNPGHLLWAGAVTPDRARRVADALLSRELFSGFGIRTMGSEEGGFNPVSYHNGSVWPHDNSLILDGFSRYRLDDHTRKLSSALLAALAYFPGRRWPELYDGFERAVFPEPIAYPGANSPQAWATGAVMLLVRAMLGLVVDTGRRTVAVHAVAVEGASYLRLRGLPIAGGRVDIDARFDAGRPPVVAVSGLPPDWTHRTE